MEVKPKQYEVKFWGIGWKKVPLWLYKYCRKNITRSWWWFGSIRVDYGLFEVIDG